MAKYNYIYLDFEYNDSSEQNLNIVCANVIYTESGIKKSTDYWLHDGSDLVAFKEFFKSLHSNKETILVAYNVEAEASSLLSLGIDPLQFKWMDLYLEYRCLLNHNHKLAYGKQLIKGKERKTRAPKNKYQMTEEQKKKMDMSKPEYNLAAACYKLLDIKIDTDFKTAIRNIIIRGDYEEVEQNRSEIQEYCASDVKHLPDLRRAVIGEYDQLLKRHPKKRARLGSDIFNRSEYGVRTAIMVRKGYPIDYDSTKAFSESVPDIIYTLQAEINDLFPEIRPFEWDKSKYKFTKKEGRIKDWIRTTDYVSKWTKTDGGDLSLSLDAFKRFYPYSHNYPKDCFGAQMVRYAALLQQLNGFKPSSGGKKTIWNSVGMCGRVRPYMNIYGSQSSRSQPSATAFIPLKSAWMRCLIAPPKGKTLIGIDFGSQEFLLAALMSQDQNMIKAYESGDVYLYFAKLAGAVPKDGKKEDYPVERNMFKTTTLGISYSMTKVGLAIQLSEALGRKVSEAEAQDLINKFERAFPVYSRYKQSIQYQYVKDKHIRLPCGFYMQGDNANLRSVGNMPLQGMGASIMRKSVEIAQDKYKLDVIFTLHDALYIECDSATRYESADNLIKAMDEGFRFYFSEQVKKQANVRMDIDCWGPDCTEHYGKTPNGNEYKEQIIYIDPRGQKEYNTFKQYLQPREFEI